MAFGSMMGFQGVGASVGRVRVTKAVLPGEPGYIRSMRLQMGQVREILLKEVKHIKGVTAEAMVYALQPIMDKSQEYVPVDSGDLKNSAFLKLRDSVSGPVAIIGYARYGQPHYAAFVHEMMNIPHQKGKSAKFLERAVTEKLDVFKRRLIRRISENSGLKK